jgi:hypothetical protein
LRDFLFICLVYGACAAIRGSFNADESGSNLHDLSFGWDRRLAGLCGTVIGEGQRSGLDNLGWFLRCGCAAIGGSFIASETGSYLHDLSFGWDRRRAGLCGALIRDGNGGDHNDLNCFPNRMGLRIRSAFIADETGSYLDDLNFGWDRRRAGFRNNVIGEG